MTLTQMQLRRDEVLNAINKIENGAQEYRIGQRTVRRADLSTLYSQWQMLNDRIEQLQRPSVTVAVLRRRR